MNTSLADEMRPTSIAAKARGLLDGLTRDLDHAETGGSVHGARRGIKRLRSLLRLIRTGVGEAEFQPANVLLKAAADALAGRRRAEALVTAAAKVKAPGKLAVRLKDLAERHRDAQVPVAGALSEAHSAVATAAQAAQAWSLPEGSGILLRDAFGKTYRKARKRLVEALKTGDATALHEARKQVIHHLHHLEMLREWLTVDQKQRVFRLEALREVLGDLNDLDELAQLAGAGSDDPLCAAMEKRRTKLIRQATKDWSPLFGRKTDAFVKRLGGLWDGAAG